VPATVSGEALFWAEHAQILLIDADGREARKHRPQRQWWR
jgi:hypothetical protein